MLSEIQPEQNQYALSIAGTFDKSTIYTALFPIHIVIDIAHNAGYKDLEWHPFQNTISGRQLKHGIRVTQDVIDGIGSLHQSWRKEKTLGEVFNHSRPFDALFSYILLPETEASISDLQRLQQVLGKKLPAVLYPLPGKTNSVANVDFAEKTYQPVPEVLNAFEVDNVEAMLKKGEDLGYDGITLDLTHMRRIEDGVSLGETYDVLTQLLPFTRQIHLSAGRVDQKSISFDPMEELYDLYRGYGRSELMKMLQYIQRSGWKGRIVTEIPASAIHQLDGVKGYFELPSQFKQKHKIIVENTQNILG